MSITTTTTRIQYTGNDTTKTFPYTFKIYTTADLDVYTTISGVDTLHVLDTDYSVTGAGVATGGNVVFVTAPVTGHTVTLIRSISPTQGTAYTVGGAFPAASHENALDKLTLMVQDLTERMNRRIPDYGVTSSGIANY